ncbi:MAG: hypothetical protein ACE5MH_06105, partial [Terriglobia bacterium]
RVGNKAYETGGRGAPRECVGRRRKGLERRIARERMAILFDLAEEEARRGNLPRADRSARLARRLWLQQRVGLSVVS